MSQTSTKALKTNTLTQTNQIELSSLKTSIHPFKKSPILYSMMVNVLPTKTTLSLHLGSLLTRNSKI